MIVKYIKLIVFLAERRNLPWELGETKRNQETYLSFHLR